MTALSSAVTTSPAAGIVELTGVSVRYGTIDALADVDLRVEVGERVALIGASGAGKTTLLDVVAGSMQPQIGTIDVLGTLRGAQRAARREGLSASRAHGRRIGVVRQHGDMALALRVVHNVNAGRLGSWSSARALWSLLRPVERHLALDALASVGLADRVDARTGDLSGGERQRVSVARVLRQQPALVLADEPTSSVDPALSDSVMHLLCGPEAPWTTIVSVHDPELARRHASRIVGMRTGRILFDRHAVDVSDSDVAAVYDTTSP